MDVSKYFNEFVKLRFLNGGVLRNLSMIDSRKMGKLYIMCWPMGSASTGRAPQQLTNTLRVGNVIF